MKARKNIEMKIVNGKFELIAEMRGLCDWMLSKGFRAHYEVSDESWQNILFVHVDGHDVRLTRGNVTVCYNGHTKRFYIAVGERIHTDCKKCFGGFKMDRDMLTAEMLEAVLEKIVKEAADAHMGEWLDRQDLLREEVLDSLK